MEKPRWKEEEGKKKGGGKGTETDRHTHTDPSPRSRSLFRTSCLMGISCFPRLPSICLSLPHLNNFTIKMVTEPVAQNQKPWNQP